MRIIYRMRGLLGDATEEFIESLDSTTGQNRCSHDNHVSDAGCCTVEGIHFLFFICVSDEEEDDEEVYKMAGVMAQCGGLECMLNRLSGIKDFKQGRHLLTVRVFNPSKFVRFFFFFNQIRLPIKATQNRAFVHYASELCVSSLTPAGSIEAVQLLREGENQQAAVGQT